MAFREVRVFEVREVLRLWLAGEGVRSVERLAQVDRKTVRRYVAAAEALGVVRDGGDGQLSDELIGMVVEAVRPHRSRWPWARRGGCWSPVTTTSPAGSLTTLTGVKIAELLGPSWRGGAGAHGAALRAGGVRTQPGSGSDGAGR